MKLVRRTIPVFGTNSDYIIGSIDCGDKALVLGETEEGTVVAYILGTIKPECSEFLIEEREWSAVVNEKEKLLCFARDSVGKRTEYFIDESLKLGGVKGGYKYVDRDDIKAGDVALDSADRCIGVYMGDGSAVVPDRQGRMCRFDIKELKKTQLARPTYPDFTKKDSVVFVRRLKKVKGCMEGDDVRAIQKALAALGLFSGKLNGRFNIKMKRAVKEFQKKNGLSVDGTVNYTVWKLLTGGIG